jgi:hypothetical protein
MKILKVLFLSLIIINAALADTLSPKVLVDIESKISIQKEELKAKISNLDIIDQMEGKIVAALINTIEDKLNTIEILLAKIDSEESLTEANIAQIQSLLDESEELISEI